MKAENRKVLQDNRPIYTTLVQAGFIQNLTNELRQSFLNIIREEFSPGYLCCLHCPADIAAMIKYVYTQFDALPIQVPIPIKSINKKKHGK